MFNFLNWYSASYSLLILGIIELAMVSWIYGKNLCTDLAERGSKPDNVSF